MKYIIPYLWDGYVTAKDRVEAARIGFREYRGSCDFVSIEMIARVSPVGENHDRTMVAVNGRGAISNDAAS